MRKLLAILSLIMLLAVGAGAAFAASNPSGTGQPSQTCLSSSAPNEPGQAANAPGSAFNESGPGTAGTVYAGNGVSATTAGSSHAVSQYDVACFQVSQSH
jgi:ABC-type glycerol-3-phosphate transport system substrate-binding protein